MNGNLRKYNVWHFSSSSFLICEDVTKIVNKGAGIVDGSLVSVASLSCFGDGPTFLKVQAGTYHNKFQALEEAESLFPDCIFYFYIFEEMIPRYGMDINSHQSSSWLVN